MELRGADGTGITLTVMGYEYPDLVDEPYDSNWLVIQLDGSTADKRWTATDPCLLTYEAHRLADWLEALVKGNVTGLCGFIEPCLDFELRTVSTGIGLRVILGHELRPPWTITQDGYVLDLILTVASLQTAVATFRTNLMAYPQRAAR